MMVKSIEADLVVQSTTKRSAMRIVREVELLGGDLSAWHSRENLVLRAKFLREDLAYFTELLAEVISKSRYARGWH
jgi:ubiquinol-cytochrome c reductase core subunit 2